MTEEAPVGDVKSDARLPSPPSIGEDAELAPPVIDPSLLEGIGLDETGMQELALQETGRQETGPGDVGPDEPGPNEPGPDEVDREQRGPEALAAPTPHMVPPPSVPSRRSDADDDDLVGIPLGLRVEALLFAAGEALPMARLRELAGCDDPAELRREVDALAAQYETSGRAFTLEEVAGGLQLRSRPELSVVVARLRRRTETGKLSPAALETLAIVAYRQPVLRGDVDKIRGVAGGEVLRGLVDRGLVRVAGRADLPGSPLLYGTTRAFLEAFGLRDLRDLPSDPDLLG